MKPAWKGHFLVMAAAAWLALVAACSAAPPPPPAPAGATGPSGASGPGPTAPGASPGAVAAATGTAELPVPAVPAPLPVLSASARAPGVSVPLAAGSPTSVEPTSSFEVRIGARLRSARLVLLDAQDAMVPSVSDIEVGTETVMTLVPDDVLRPGSTYLVRVEGLSGRLLQSDGGKSFEPAGFPLQTTGTAPPKAPPKKSGKRRRGG